MRRPRFQFRLSTLLWITLAVACWFGGMKVEQWMAKRHKEPKDWPFALTLDKGNSGQSITEEDGTLEVVDSAAPVQASPPTE